MIESYITGSNGFIGSQLKERLAMCVPISHESIQSRCLYDCQRFYFLSAYGNMAQHKDTGKILEANISDLVHVLKYLFLAGNGLFVYMSSSSVNLPVKTSYSLTKQAGEKIVESAKLPYAIIRPYSVTGVGEQKEHLIPKLISSCINQEPMELVAEATHDFIDVSDVVNGVTHLSENRFQGIFELGTGIPTSNIAVLKLVENATGKKANIRYVNSIRAYDNHDWYCRDNRARDHGWKPVKTLQQSIEEMVKAYEHP